MTQLVIGYGQLGHAIVHALLQKGHSVRVLDIATCDNPNVHAMQGDIRNYDAVRDACDGIETVYHTASAISQSLGKPSMLHEVNVEGTANIIRACEEKDVQALVYTSSIDVVFDGTPISGGDETLPYPSSHLDYYGTTKMLAEQRVLAANSDTLHTVSLRVAGLYGMNDQHRFPSIMQQVLAGRFIRLGDGKARFNHLYIENAAHAHLLAAEALKHTQSVVGGQAYFITDYEATNFFDFVWDYVQALGFSVKERRIPTAVVSAIANTNETLYRLLPLPTFASPLLTKYVVASTCRDFWFIHDKATHDFGYQPIVTLEDATARTLQWLREAYLVP